MILDGAWYVRGERFCPERPADYFWTFISEASSVSACGVLSLVCTEAADFMARAARFPAPRPGARIALV